MTRVWWAQIKAVIRLEMKKTFFAKRGLWIYVVALLPVLLFIAYAVAMSHQHGHSAEIARRGDKPLRYEDLLAIKPDMTKEEVIALLGKPPVNIRWKEQQSDEHGFKRRRFSMSTMNILTDKRSCTLIWRTARSRVSISITGTIQGATQSCSPVFSSSSS